MEQEGTYPLPEAQRDRFIMEIRVGYPSIAQALEAKYQQARRHFEQVADALRELQPIDVDQALAKKLAEMAQQAAATQEQLAAMQSAEDQPQAPLSEEQKQQLELNKIKTEAISFAQAVRDSQAQAEMAACQQETLNENFADSQQAAERAAEILESFLGQCQGMGVSAIQNRQRGFRPSKCNMGNSLQQMMAMMGMKPGSSGTRPGGKPGTGTAKNLRCARGSSIRDSIWSIVTTIACRRRRQIS